MKSRLIEWFKGEGVLTSRQRIGPHPVLGRRAIRLNFLFSDDIKSIKGMYVYGLLIHDLSIFEPVSVN